MKAKKQIFVLFLTMLVGIPILFAQNKKEQKKQKVEVARNIIASKNYRIDVDTYIHPDRDPILLDGADNSIEIRNDSVFSTLLYLGQVDIPYGRRGAELFFQAPLKKMKLAAIFAGLVSVFTFSSCLNDGGALQFPVWKGS